ncbi:hypothetical protein M3Y99_01508900 [Aphelenchoides fujianensis]|nr:hypothetical protein M3Y99_01508900 [Aphelenchoides fujianensis]
MAEGTGNENPQEARPHPADLGKLLRNAGIEGTWVFALEIVDARRALIALHHIHSLGLARASVVRTLAKEFIKHFRIEPALLTEQIEFYINDASEHLSIAYKLFTVFYNRAPQSINSDEKFAKWIRWLNRGIAVGLDMVSVMTVICKAAIEHAVDNHRRELFINEVFVNSQFMLIHYQWTRMIKGSAGTYNRAIREEVGRLSVLRPSIDGLPDPHMLSNLELLGNESSVHETANAGVLENYVSDDEEYGAAPLEVDDVVLRYLRGVLDFLPDSFERPSGLNEHVIHMADIIGAFADQAETEEDAAAARAEEDEDEDEWCPTPMPRTLIQQFYRALKAHIDERLTREPVERAQQLVFLLLLTHSKKIISMCTHELNAIPDGFTDAEKKAMRDYFFPLLVSSDVLNFRTCAVTIALLTLCRFFALDVAEVVTRFRAMSTEVPEMSDYCDRVLGDVLMGRKESVDFRAVYGLLGTNELSKFHRTRRL